MIEQLRSPRGKVIMRYLLIGVIASMALGSILTSVVMWYTGEGKRKPLITVNDREVTEHEVQQKAYNYAQQIAYIRQQFGAQADMLLRMIGYNEPPENLAISDIIRNHVLLSGADSANIDGVARAVLEEKIEDPSFALQYLEPIISQDVYDQTGAIQEDVLQQRLDQFGMSYEGLLRQTQEALRRKLYTDLMETCFYVSGAETKGNFLQKYVSRTYAYITFSLDAYLNRLKEEGASQETLQNFFNEQNKQSKRYYVPEQRKGTYWTFDPSAYGIQISDEAVNKYYKQHKSSYIKEPAQVELRHIFLKAEDGNKEQVRERADNIAQELQENSQLFTKKAKNVSDADDAEKGGYIGFVSKKSENYSSAVLNAAFKLDDDGDVSNPIEVENGFEILIRVSKKKTTYKPVEDVADEIRAIKQKEQFKQRFKSEAVKIIQKSKNDPDAFQDFLERKGAEKHTTEMVTQKNAASQAEQRLFQLSESGKRAAFLEEDTGYILELTDIEPTYLPSFEEQIETVREDYYNTEAYNRLQRDVASAQDMINKDDATMEDVAHRYNLSVESATLPNENVDRWSKLQNAGLPTERMKHMIHPGYALEHVENKNGFVVMLSDIAPLDPEVFAEKQDELAQNVHSANQNQYSQAFVASLYRDATIDYNTDYFKSTQ